MTLDPMKAIRLLAAGLAAGACLAPAAADDWARPVLVSGPGIEAQARDVGQSSASEYGEGVLVSGQPYPGLFDTNVPGATRRAMADDLAFVKSIRGEDASDLHRRIFGAVDGPAYFKFFESRVKAVGLDPGPVDRGVMAYVRGFPAADYSKMWLTPNYVNYSMPQIERVEIIFHESRHTEMEHDFWHHAKCPNPFLDENGKPVHGVTTDDWMAGLAACDTTPYGSYGSALIMIKNIQKFCGNCTQKVKMDAGLYADDTLNRIIDPEARRAIKDDLYR